MLTEVLDALHTGIPENWSSGPFTWDPGPGTHKRDPGPETYTCDPGPGTLHLEPFLKHSHPYISYMSYESLHWRGTISI